MLRSRRDSFLSDHDGKVSFEPNEFLAEGFSVDEFIQNKRTRVPLDVLRDDLGSHLKFLRSSLIELINQDYGQFVNLSSNLVGLDGRIQNISGPLYRAKNDLHIFVTSLDSNIKKMKEELELKKTIRQSKRQLQYHKMALLAVESSEKHMRRVPLEITSEVEFSALSLTCEELANAQFLLQNCQESPMSAHAKKRLNVLMDEAMKRVNSLFIHHSAVKLDASTDKRCDSLITSLLHLYIELQKVAVAENIFTQNVLKPVCDEVLSKKGNVSSLLDEVEQFLVNSPTMKASKELEEYSWMLSYHFVTNCVLPHVVGVLKKHFPHIWSPSNPDSFHLNWIRCERFIKFLEEEMPSLDHLEKFRESDTLKEFISKWQFPVYFQLRFHALAVELESVLEDPTSPCANTDFKLDSTRVLIKVLTQCWDSDKIYISHIAGRFLKASALVISRFLKALEVEMSSKENVAITVLLNVYCDLKLAELTVQQIIAEKLQQQLNYSASDSVDVSSNPSLVKLPTVASDFFNDFPWQNVRDYVENRVIQLTVSQSSASISLVTEVPRLYRRTNRELPTKHGEYVEGILQPITALKSTILNAHQGQLWEGIGFKIASEVSKRYKSQVDEVLISVLRMEESLKRLKKVKGQSVGGSENNKVLSDDDKIRKQIQIDISYFTTQIKTLCPTVDTLPLINIFDKANGTS